MYQKTIEHKFQPGDLVTLKAMLPGEGNPQKFAVVYVRGDWDDTWPRPSVRYYCRALGGPGKSIHGPPAVSSGLYLLDEPELVGYEAECKEKKP